jgi:hypothetical protein
MGRGSCGVERLEGVTTPGAMPALPVPNRHLGDLAAVPDRYKGLENCPPPSITVATESAAFVEGLAG